ncbi:hypothetical protein BST81_26630 [Leptolyngbya sp. 'hensonii']|nr:hypothetical protein BST81_26630 [Leptolyngbya sp. 'hensonii']
MEWTSGGFSRTQLIINYAGFLPMPFLMIGLYAYQRPRIGLVGLIGSVLYGVAFIYFAHTTMIALEQAISNYEILLGKLEGVYTFHGGLMVVGGTMFGIASLHARVLWQGAVSLFMLGIILNLGVALLPLPDILQILGSSVRNFGLIAMGVSVIRESVVFPESVT